MKREDLIKRNDFWTESIREMQILHWQDSDLTIKEILKLKNELINSLSGTTVKLREACSKNTQHEDMKSANWKYCSECGKKL